MGQAGKFQPHDLARTVKSHTLDDVAALGRLRTVAPDRLLQSALGLGVFTDQDIQAFPFGHFGPPPRFWANKKSQPTQTHTWCISR
ncbi:MAG: hypothetical protein SOR83_10350 [Butyricicoccus pullicaecorum]|nr:hypothetical protein [Butyricicoccus pullicaecorum]